MGRPCQRQKRERPPSSLEGIGELRYDVPQQPVPLWQTAQFYTFTADSAGALTVDIDSTFASGVSGIDLLVRVYDANGTAIGLNNDPTSLDPGSTALSEPRLDMTLPG